MLSEAFNNIYNNNKLKWDFNKNKTDKKYLKKVIKIKIKWIKSDILLKIKIILKINDFFNQKQAIDFDF